MCVPCAAALSPDELREALSALHKGSGAINIDLSEMHDAGEVLAEVLASLHRAQLGRPAGEVQDPQLPQRVRVRAPEAPSRSSATANGGSSGGGYAAAVGTSCQGPASQGPASSPGTDVHRLFGLDVQLPCPPESEDEPRDVPSPSEAKRAARINAAQQRSNSSGNASISPAQSQQQLAPVQQQQQQSPSTGPAAVAAATAPQALSAKKLREQGLIEVQQYTKVRGGLLSICLLPLFPTSLNVGTPCAVLPADLRPLVMFCCR